MAEELKALSVADAENIESAILALVLAFPDYPNGFDADNTTVKWDNINTDTSIGLFTMNGGAYLRRYVSGSYTAQFPFRIVYKSSPTTNKGSIDAQEVVSKLAKWLESCGVNFKDEHYTLESIERTSHVYCATNEGNTKEYTCTMQALFEYKK